MHEVAAHRVLQHTAQATSDPPATFNWKCDLLAFGLFLVLALQLQWLSSAYQSEFGGHPDEPAHYVTGLMVRDYIVTSFGKHPMVFAEDYYDHYPKVALGNWPPMFYVLQTLWTIPFSPARTSLLVLMAVLTATVAWITFRALSADVGRWPAFVGGALFVALPLVQEHTSSVMNEIATTLFVFPAALVLGRFLDRGCTHDTALFGMLAALGILTKGSALALAIVAPFAVLFSGRFHVVVRPGFWLPVPIVLVLAGPWTFKFRDVARAGWCEQSPTWSFTQEALAYYPAHLVLAVGFTLFILALIGIVFRIVQLWHREPGQGKWAAAMALLISVVLMQLIIPCGLESRHLIPALPALIMFVTTGAAALFRIFGKWHGFAWAMLAIVFFVSTFRVHQKQFAGFGPLAEVVRQQLPDARMKALISSDATGEGVFIAEVAVREKRPEHTIRRASKVLAHSSWSGAGYQAKFGTSDALIAELTRDGIAVVVTDDSMPANLRVRHHNQLISTLDTHKGAFKLIGTYPMTRAGVCHVDAIRVYRRQD